MELLHRILLFIHICAGFSALSLFFVPAFARKGGRVHNAVGRWYVRGMWVVLGTAALLSLLLLTGPHWEKGVFFGFLAILTSQPLYYGIAILKYKREVPAVLRRRNIAMLSLTLVSAVGVLALGSGLVIEGSNPLLLAFGIIGMIAGGTGIRSELNGGRVPWLEQHLSGMIISAIAAFTAFFSFGGRRLLSGVLTGNWELLPWIAPTVLGVIAIRWWKRKLRLAPRVKHQGKATDQQPKEFAG